MIFTFDLDRKFQTQAALPRRLRAALEHRILMSLPQLPNVCDDECGHIRGILNRVGDKWSLQVIAELAEGPKRFGDLRRSIEGLSHRMLTLTLRLLEREGLVSRTVLATVPAGIEYGLTEIGCTFIEPVRFLANWARQYAEHIHAARKRFDEEVEVAGSGGRTIIRMGVR